MNPEISRLFFYPIKSFRGVETKTMKLTPQGAEWDRKWMLVDAKNQFITQRTMPQLARIGVDWIDDSSVELMQNGETLCDFGLNEQEGEQLTVTVWKDQVPAFEVSSEVSEALSQVLDKPVKLVRMADECKRLGRFGDSQPLLVLSEESNKGLEELAKTSLSIVRFRPNIVIRHCLPHSEDIWNSISAGSLTLRRIKPSTRCKIAQIHPLTGEVGEEPLKTLMTYRQIENKIAFGQYYGNDQSGEIRVGQILKVN
jgi:uncharacterized protein YcbX